MSDRSGYSTSGNSAGPVSAAGSDVGYWDIGKLKRAYSDYLIIKREEIEEAKESRRYYHGAQWTDEQIKILKKRKQPIMTINRISRKIDGFVGTLEKLRQDPKAYPRTPGHEAGADLATAALRYVLDEQEWQPKSSEAARDGGIEGISGLEILLVDGDTKDPNDKDVAFDIVEPDSFFYDPRSYRADFSDATYMGVGKWMTADQAKQLIPNRDEDIDGAESTGGDELTSNPDRDNKWFTSDRKYIRLVECWYQHKGEWCWAIFTGASILLEGKSYLFDEKNKTECKYIMYSGNIDHDGDRYGFVRNMKSIQDGINFKEAKLHHIMGSNRLILRQGAVDDIEKTRTEWNRPDGTIVENFENGIRADDRTFDFAGFQKLLEDNKSEIENFGVNPAVLGEGVEKQSGRAISLLQQAGIAELGPYVVAYRGWKIRCYRAIFNALQRYWTGERWIRVTDDDQVAQFIQINGVQVDPMTGHPQVVNAIGSLDVDIIIDEGPDNINMQADTYDALIALASNGAQVPPQVLLELAPGIDSRTKKKILGMLEQQSQKPDPEVAKAQAKIEADKQTAAIQVEQKAKEFELEQRAEMAKADNEMKLEAAKADQEMAIKQREAELEMEIEARKAEQQLEIERIKANANLEVERARANQGLEVEKIKGDMSLKADKQRHEMKGEKKPEKKEDDTQAATIEALKALAASIGEMNKNAARPRKLIRDAQGRPESSVLG